MLIKSILEVIGHTPILEIDPSVHGLQNINLFAKLEHLNPFGSIKDRTALNILKDQLPMLKENGQSVIESSSGNMAKAMQIVCSMYGVPFRLVADRIQVLEVKKLLRILGAEMAVSVDSAIPSSENCKGSGAQIASEMMAQPGKYFHTNQYNNDLNRQTHFDTTGPEILSDLKEKVDYFIAPMGTSGSSRGTGGYLKSQNPELKTIGIIAGTDQIIPGTRTAEEMKSVGLFQRSFYDFLIEVSVEDAIEGMLTLSRKLGVLCGPSSGATYTAAIKQLTKIDQTLVLKRNAVFIVCDRMESYMSYLKKYRPEFELQNQ